MIAVAILVGGVLLPALKSAFEREGLQEMG
jgi:hypothetical protein